MFFTCAQALMPALPEVLYGSEWDNSNIYFNLSPICVGSECNEEEALTRRCILMNIKRPGFKIRCQGPFCSMKKVPFRRHAGFRGRNGPQCV